MLKIKLSTVQILSLFTGDNNWWCEINHLGSGLIPYFNVTKQRCLNIKTRSASSSERESHLRLWFDFKSRCSDSSSLRDVDLNIHMGKSVVVGGPSNEKPAVSGGEHTVWYVDRRSKGGVVLRWEWRDDKNKAFEIEVKRMQVNAKECFVCVCVRVCVTEPK